jgi:hypothetical protein
MRQQQLDENPESMNDFQSSGDELTVATRASGSGLTDEEKTETEEMGIKIGYLAGYPAVLV